MQSSYFIIYTTILAYVVYRLTHFLYRAKFINTIVHFLTERYQKHVKMAESNVEDGKFWYLSMFNAVVDESALSSVMLESFSRVKSREQQLKFQINSLRMVGASLDVISERVKNNEKAQQYRKNGNHLFSSNGDSVETAEMYTKSIAYAFPGSRELSLAYGNRSAVSFKAEEYEECLLDIERALENDYPEEMRAKLYARRVRCLVALEKPQTEIEKALNDTREALLKMDSKASGRDLIEKTLNEENHMAPMISKKKGYPKMKPTIQDDSGAIRGASGITIQYSKKYGKHIVATRDIRPGEIIAVIDNYATVRGRDKCYRECAHCTNETAVGIPCDHCVNVVYCSTSCRDKAWKEYHETECPILGVMLDLEFEEISILAVKITLRALQEAGSIMKLKKMVKRIDSVSNPRVKGFTNNVLDCTKYACIYTLASHTGKYDNEQSYLMSLMSTFTIYYLATLTDIFAKKYPGDLKVFDKNSPLSFLGGLLIRNCEIVQMTVTRVPGEDDVQIAPFIALCNHSCDSNVTSKGTNKNTVFSLQPIKAGDQIWDNYQRLHYSRFPKAKRQQSLKEHYLFTCNCVACVKNWPMLEKLPSAFEMPGLSPTIRTQISELREIFLDRRNQSLVTGDFLAPKDELVQLIELFFKHACPCKEIITYRQSLMDMYGYGLDIS